jgi:hypothetical protein
MVRLLSLLAAATVLLCALPGVANATVSVTPTSYDFTNVVVGSSGGVHTFQVTSTVNNESVLNVSVTGANPSQFRTDLCTQIPSGGCTLTVTFEPTTRGPKSATVTIDTASNDPTVAVQGTGVAPIISTPSTLSLGSQSVGTGSSSMDLIVTNSTTDTGQFLVPTSAVLGDSQFVIGGGTCTITNGVSPNGTCRYQVVFDPTSIGLKSTTLTITSNDPVTPIKVITVTGTGTAPDIDVTPVSVDFGDQPITDGATATTSITIANQASGVGSESLEYTIGNSNATNFQLAAGTCTLSGAGTIAVNSSCTFTVRFDPSTTGAKSGTITITSDDPDESAVLVSLGGSGTDREIAVSPSLVAFGDHLVDAGASATQTVTIQNTGGAPLIYAASVFSTQFNVAPGTCPGLSGTLAANSSCTLLVSFDPSTAGAAADSLVITSNDTDEPTTTIALTGTGTMAPPPQASIAPSTIEFGTRAISAGKSAARTVTLTNSGTLALTPAAIAVSAPFAAAGASCAAGSAVQPGQSCTVQVTFNPTVVGRATTNLTWAHDGTGSPATVTLGGTGCSYLLLASCPGTDRITGTARADVLYGGAGPDMMLGGLGNDRLYGGAGADIINGGAGRDTLSGGIGNDRILGGLDIDTIRGDAGNDTIDVRGGGADVVNCGAGLLDVALVDRTDRTTGCERVRVS